MARHLVPTRIDRALAGAAALAFSVPALAANGADAVPPAAAAQPIDIRAFDIDGNSVLDDDSIAAAVAPFMGPGRTADDVDKARAALESRYRENGYRTVAVSIPPQTVRDGIIALQVTEGRVGHLQVVGSKYHSLDRIREQAPALAEGAVPDFDSVQQDIVALNQQADRRVTPSLRAGKRPGTVDIDLVVDDKLPLHGALELNNRYSQDTSELRAVGTLSYDNLWQRGHSLSLSFQTAPQETDDAKVVFGSYLLRDDESPWSLLFNALNSDSAVSTVGGINVLGNGYSFGLTAIRRLEGSADFYPSISLGIHYKDFDTQTQLEGAAFDTPVEYYPMSLGWSGLLRRDHSTTQFDTSLNFASPQLGSNTSTIQLNRYRARGQMFWLRGGVAHTQDFTNGMQAFVRVAAQLTDQPLISNEQISAGGMDTARGYLEAEALGDYGIGGTIEWRSRSFEPSLPFGKLDELRLFAFVDGAELRLQGPLPDDSSEDQVHLLSVGAGLDLGLSSVLRGVLDWAVPLEDGPNTESGDSRVLFRVWTAF